MASFSLRSVTSSHGYNSHRFHTPAHPATSRPRSKCAKAAAILARFTAYIRPQDAFTETVTRATVTAHDSKLQESGDETFLRGAPCPAFHGFSNQAARRLTLLDSAETLRDFAALRSNRLEALRGDRSGQHSIRINAQWRICFRWSDDGPWDVEIADYH